MSEFGIYSGAVGWNFPHWRESFYPEDLPKDWQLAFYNTQFRCVYLTCEVWSKASDEQVNEWLNETQERFRFVLQDPDGLDPDLVSLAERFGQRGVLERDIKLHWLKGQTDLRKLADQMRQMVKEGEAFYLVSNDGDLAKLRQITELMDILGV